MGYSLSGQTDDTTSSGVTSNQTFGGASLIKKQTLL